MSQTRSLHPSHPLFVAERLDLESSLRSLKEILHNDLQIRSTTEILSTRSSLGSGIGFLNRSIIEGYSPDLKRIIDDCRSFSAENRIDIFYPSESDRIKQSSNPNPRLNDFYEIAVNDLRPRNFSPSPFEIHDINSPEDYTDKILTLGDRASIVHRIFTAMSKRADTQRFTVSFEDKLIAAASYTFIEGGILKLSGVQVDEAFRNQGLQKRLIMHRIQHALRRHKFEKVYSIAKRATVSSQNLEKLHFHRTAVFDFGS